LALADAFGCSVDPRKTKNSELREVIGKCRKIMETVNKSRVLKAKFDERQKSELGKELKLKNTPTHRWSATEDVLIKILRCWNPLRQAFLRPIHHLQLKAKKILIRIMLCYSSTSEYSKSGTKNTKVSCIPGAYALNACILWGTR
jgi:hypothetical protein